MRSPKQKRSAMRSWVIFSLTAIASMLKLLEENYIRNLSMKVHISQVRWEVLQLLQRIRDQKELDPNNYLNNFYTSYSEANSQKDVKYGCEGSNS